MTQSWGQVMGEGESHPCAPLEPPSPAPVTAQLRAAPYPPSASGPITSPSGPSQGSFPQRPDIHPKTLSRQGWARSPSPSCAISAQLRPPQPTPSHSRGQRHCPPWPQSSCCSSDILWLRIQTVSIFMVFTKKHFSLQKQHILPLENLEKHRGK